jgi:hypothetical protein
MTAHTRVVDDDVRGDLAVHAFPPGIPDVLLV